MSHGEEGCLGAAVALGEPCEEKADLLPSGDCFTVLTFSFRLLVLFSES